MTLTANWIECRYCKNKHKPFIRAMAALDEMEIAMEMMIRPVQVCLGCFQDCCPLCAASDEVQGHGGDCDELYTMRKKHSKKSDSAY